MLILRLCLCLVLISVCGVFGVAVTGMKRTESSTSSTPAPTPAPTPVDGYSRDVQALGLYQAGVITMIKFVTETVKGPYTPRPVSVAYAMRDEKADAWVAVNHGEDAIRSLEPLDEKLEKREEKVTQAGFTEELCSLLVEYNMPHCSTLTVTSTLTLPGTASPNPIPIVQNCAPTDPAYKLLIFDDYYPRNSIDPTVPIVSPHEPGPPADSFIYYNMKFSGNFSFMHCEANPLGLESRLARTCNNNTVVGDYFFSLYSPVSPAPFKGPVKRFISFEGHHFCLVDMLISTFPVPQGASSGVVSVIIKGYTSDVETAKATFIDVRYVRGGLGETRLKITYELSFYNLVRVEVVAVEGEWKMSDGEDWEAKKWKGRGAPLYIDDLAVCRYY